MSYGFDLQREIHKNAIAHGFWSKKPNIPEKLALVHSEVSEALEELRLPKFNRTKFGEELGDIIIRVMDIAEYYKIDAYAYAAWKHERNVKRPFRHGKKF